MCRCFPSADTDFFGRCTKCCFNEELQLAGGQSADLDRSMLVLHLMNCYLIAQYCFLASDWNKSGLAKGINEKECKHSWRSTALQNILEVVRTLKLSLRKRWMWLHPHKDSWVTLLVPDTSLSPFQPAAARSLSLTNEIIFSATQTAWHPEWVPPYSTGPVPPVLGVTGALGLSSLPCMNFRGKCQPALKLSVDFSSMFKTLINLFTAAVAVINVLYVFPFWKIKTGARPK